VEAVSANPETAEATKPQNEKTDDQFVKDNTGLELDADE